MTALQETSETTGLKEKKTKRDARLSRDGKWRTFPKAPNLVQYVGTGVYFGRVKIDGKVFRESLKADVYTTAKLLLGDWIKKKIKRAAKPIAGTFAAARKQYEAEAMPKAKNPRSAWLQNLWKGFSDEKQDGRRNYSAGSNSRKPWS